MENITLNDQQDKIIWRWTPGGKYSAKSAYNMMHVGAVPFRGHKLIWKAWGWLCGGDTGRRTKEHDTDRKRGAFVSFATRSQNRLTTS